MKPKFATVFAQLYLKVSEDEKAFPYIEKLAQSNPRKAKDLAEEFVRVWTKNHNPNSQQLRRSRFFYIYGFDNRSEGIPLTRSKQERNLVELADLGQEAAQAADRRDRREAVDPGVHDLP